jgi:urea carboxylase
MLRDDSASIAAFKARQQAAFEAERERWKIMDATQEPVADKFNSDDSMLEPSSAVPPDCIAVSSPVTGSVWQMNVSVGQRVTSGEELLVVEAMKMEIPIVADESAEVVELRCARGRTVSAGETLVVLRPQ